MATLLLTSLGSALGNSFLPSLQIFGQSFSGAAIGQGLGAIAGRFIDQSLLGGAEDRLVEGPRLKDLEVVTSSEGEPILRVYGKARISGTMIWATKLEEVRTTTSQSVGSGKNFGGGGGRVVQIAYDYYANFAIGLGEAGITHIGRVWADGKLIDLSDYQTRFYDGSETQNPDLLISLKENSTPAYRGLSYIVFEHFPLGRFGNRIPQLSFEVFHPLDDFEQKIKGVTMIPGAGEFTYDPDEVLRDIGFKRWVSTNRHSLSGKSDWGLSLDQMQDQLKSVENISLIVSWFGSDLRAGDCQIKPKVDRDEKNTKPQKWQVAGLTRNIAEVVTSYDDGPAYGGSPHDQGIINAIKDLNSRGLKCTFNPFILMDIPHNNQLTDPYSSGTQSAYPWRGRITCDPGPDQPATADKTAAARGQIESFLGTAQVSDFSIEPGKVVYQGPNEWSYRRFILHYAYLCKLAGGVDAFLIGSEMRGLSWVRDQNNAYPFVEGLVQLAADVKAVLGPDTKVTYGADWSEYFGHQPSEGSGDVTFHLDPLWASNDIDAIGIDCYWPLADWRDGDQHLDKLAGAQNIYDLEYLKGNIKGGEGYDYYYASKADRDQQIRTPITDGAYNKPWTYRFKDIWSWWENQHYNREGGVEETNPTSWVPKSKPIWFTEIGCGAVEKGANQPNKFSDPKSSEDALPYYSNGTRDDYMQRQFISAFLDFFDHQSEGFQTANNPVSPVYNGPMVPLDRFYIYTWDARPYPQFPALTKVWSDGESWQTGHWLSGRLGAVSLQSLFRHILNDYDIVDFDISKLHGVIDGFVIDQLLTGRGALQGLQKGLFIDGISSGKKLVFQLQEMANEQGAFLKHDFVEVQKDGPLFSLLRRQETDLPRSVQLSFIDADQDYHIGAVQSDFDRGFSSHVAAASLPIVTKRAFMNDTANRWLDLAHSEREQIQFSLPPSMIALEVGDVVSFDPVDENVRAIPNWRITAIEDGLSRSVTAVRYRKPIYETSIQNVSIIAEQTPSAFGPPTAYFLDIPKFRQTDQDHYIYGAFYQAPWPGAMTIYQSKRDEEYRYLSSISSPAIMGEVLSSIEGQPDDCFHSRLDYGTTIQLRLFDGQLESISKTRLLEGGNLAAIAHEDTEGKLKWEIFQFQKAELTGENSYQLSHLIRGKKGTNDVLTLPIDEAAPFVLLDESIEQIPVDLEGLNTSRYWRYGAERHELSSLAFDKQILSPTGQGLAPLSPVHIQMKENQGGLDISWIRRTRIGGDLWGVIDVPLSEDEERYALDIFNHGQLVHQINIQEPFYHYENADLSALSVTVYQISSLYGRGKAGRATYSH